MVMSGAAVALTVTPAPKLTVALRKVFIATPIAVF